MNDIRYEAAKKEDLREAARVLSIAIAPTPNSIALWGGSGEKYRRQIEKTLMVVLLKNPHFRTILARQEGKIVGVHSMLPWPHCQPSFWEGLRLFPWIFPLAIRASIRGLALQLASSRLDPHEEHWHLGPIGVLPGMRSHGIGRQLVTTVLEDFDREGIPAYLETDQIEIVRQEERLGFRVIGEEKIIGVHNWLMWRVPKAEFQKD